MSGHHHHQTVLPFDYGIWDRVVGVVCGEETPNIAMLKRWVARVWRQLDTDYVRTVCSAFRHRLEEVVVAEGSQVEKHLRK